MRPHEHFPEFLEQIFNSTSFVLNGTWHKIFDLLFFSSKNSPLAPDARAKAFLK
jgi:hypothetical protein